MTPKTKRLILGISLFWCGLLAFVGCADDSRHNGWTAHD